MPEIRFVKSLWGMEESFGAALERIARAGYSGFENPIGGTPAGEFGGLDYCAQAFPDSVEDVARAIEGAAERGAVVLTLQAGRDWWEEDRAAAFFEGALALESPFPVAFETHRGKLLFTPGSTARMLRRFPELRIAADFSHWTCVCESNLSDQAEAVELAISRTVHLHARVGHAEGPQVPDPLAPRWLPWTERFEGWWDRIVAEFPGEVLRVDPEFGPPDYLWTDPAAGDRPLVDLFEVCGRLRDRLAARWV